MKTFTHVVTDALGIHARPAGLLVKIAAGFESTITVEKEGKKADCKRIMALMGLGAKQGTTITVSVEGPDEEAAATAVRDFLKANL